MIERDRKTRRQTLLLLLALTGCNDNENARVAQIAEQSAQRQAVQNQEMASLNRQMAEAHARQIEAEAEAREKLLAMSQGVDDQRSQLEAERHKIVDERRELAEDQRWDSVLGPTLLGIATLAASVMPLKHFGAAWLPSSFEVAGLGPGRSTDPTPPLWEHVVDVTARTRKSSRGFIPKEYIPFSGDGGDYEFYLDTSNEDADGECPVVVLGPGRDGVIICASFVEFIERAVSGRLEY